MKQIRIFQFFGPDGCEIYRACFLSTITLDTPIKPGQFIGCYIRAYCPMSVTQKQLYFFFSSFGELPVCILFDLLDILDGSVISQWGCLSFGVGTFLSCHPREKFPGNDVQNAGRYRYNDKIKYRANTQYDQKNEICRTRIGPFLQYRQSRYHGHQQPDDNNYRQQYKVTIDLAVIHFLR